MSIKQELGKLLGKQHVSMVSTGMAAIETALAALNIGQGDHVLLPSESCYTVGAAIVRTGAVPVFMDTGKALVIGKGPAWEQVNWQSVKAIIAIHEHGLPCDIKMIRQTFPSIPIIEDASLAFGLEQGNQSIGEYSDIVVMSLGPGKPLDTNGGGILATNDERVMNVLDKGAGRSRYNAQPPLPYEVSDNLFYFLELQMPVAWQQLEERRKAAKMIYDHLAGPGFETYKLPEGSKPCWHRIPVWAANNKLRADLLQSSNADIRVLPPHSTLTCDLPMFSNRHVRIKACDPMHSENFLLIKAKAVDAAEKWIDGLKKSSYGH